MNIVTHYREMRQMLQPLKRWQHRRLCGVLVADLLDRHRSALALLPHREQTLILNIERNIEGGSRLFWESAALQLQRFPDDNILDNQENINQENLVTILEMIENFIGVIRMKNIKSSISCIEITTDDYSNFCSQIESELDPFDSPILDRFLKAQRLLLENIISQQDVAFQNHKSIFTDAMTNLEGDI